MRIAMLTIPELQVLAPLVHNGKMAAAEIIRFWQETAKFEQNSGTLSATLKRLENEGLISSELKEGSRRQRQYWVTEEGREKFAEARLVLEIILKPPR